MMRNEEITMLSNDN